jgi:hypothetical protein
VIKKNEKIEQVTIIVVHYWFSNDGAATVPPNESRITIANEDKKCVGPILRAHMRGGIGCDLATSMASVVGIFHEWIGVWTGG